MKLMKFTSPSLLIDRQTKTGLYEAGFADPHEDPSTKDINSWISEWSSNDLDQSQAHFILENICDQFDEILGKEKQTKSSHKSKGVCFIYYFF